MFILKIVIRYGKYLIALIGLVFGLKLFKGTFDGNSSDMKDPEKPSPEEIDSQVKDEVAIKKAEFEAKKKRILDRLENDSDITEEQIDKLLENLREAGL